MGPKMTIQETKMSPLNGQIKKREAIEKMQEDRQNKKQKKEMQKRE